MHIILLLNKKYIQRNMGNTFGYKNNLKHMPRTYVLNYDNIKPTMYMTDFVCTYKELELEDEESNSDMLYQAQFLQVFGIAEYRDDAIRAGLEQVKTKADEVPELKALILQHPYAGSSLETDDLLPLMFAYPLFDVFHLCLIDAFRAGRISAENRDKVLCAYKLLELL